MNETRRKAGKRATAIILLAGVYVLAAFKGYYEIMVNISSYNDMLKYVGPAHDFKTLTGLATIVFWVCLGRRLHDINLRAWWILAIMFIAACTNEVAGSLANTNLGLAMFLCEAHLLVMLAICLIPAKLEGNRFIDNQSEPNENAIMKKYFSLNTPELKRNIFLAVAFAAAILLGTEAVTRQMIKEEIKAQCAETERVHR